MDGEANLPASLAPPEPGPTNSTLVRPINPESNLSRYVNSTSSSSSSSFYSSSPPGLLRQLQASFKHNRYLGAMQLNNIRPRRTVVPRRETLQSSASNLDPTVGLNKTQGETCGGQSHGVGDCIAHTVNAAPGVNENQVDASMTPPSMCGTITNTYGESIKLSDIHRDQSRLFADNESSNVVTTLLVEHQHDPLLGGQKKVQFSLRNNDRSQGMEWDAINQPEAAISISHDLNHQNGHNIGADVAVQSYGADSSLVAKRSTELKGQLHQVRNFLHSDLKHPMTQSSVVGSSCAPTTLDNSISAPMLSSMTYRSQPLRNCQSSMAIESLGECNANSQSKNQGDMVHPCTSSKSTDRTSFDKTAIGSQGNEPKETDTTKDDSLIDKSNQGKGLATGDATDLQSHASLSKNPSLEVKLGPSKSEKLEKVASGKATHRKRNYDPDVFFKVNGKLYQRLGKIGSGGSSEVHKVISSDCKIYALKKIKLRGRDYATSYGFCQEIEYLNKLKGKNHIIQLIDYEVTDEILLQHVMNGSMSNKDGRVKEDGYIYMVLEHGEIDLAHMLSQKWKEIDGTDSTIDENWLRFYWQQILLAVNTIHEERIVHSDLKPANFLLVRGSLKLIDFGIAKAIMSDTTNIQRDSQVGTLSYMSPEAFMCNETDANGNTIKCGRPSDIWSLGCILYQMVYGRTPFSEYKTFWAKFKVITDPYHEIMYEPMSNPWLVDLMKKCLAWDRNERWRIPQLLQHPFLVPPIPPGLSSCQDQSCKLLQLIAESCANDQKALMLCAQLQELLSHPRQTITARVSISRDQQRKFLSEISNICSQLQEQLGD